MIDYKAIIAFLTPEGAAWEDAEGPESGVGVSYWYGRGENEYARVNVDQDHIEITHGHEGETEDDEEFETLWSGSKDDLAEHPDLGRFVAAETTPPM